MKTARQLNERILRAMVVRTHLPAEDRERGDVPTHIRTGRVS